MTTKKRWTFDPDVTRLNDPVYWSAVLALAIRDGNSRRASLAEKHLKRLDYPIRRVPQKGGAV